MSKDLAIQVEGLAKRYRLGVMGGKTMKEDLSAWLARRKNNRGLDSASRAENGIFWALRDINFEIPQGEIVGIIGKNGAGKSTLLKLLSRITSPTLGEIRINGRMGSLLEVGTGFHPELTGRENMYLNGAILGMSKAEINKKLDEILDFSGIEHHIDTPVKRYSSGMKVRLGFAVAAHLEPEILVIDEVLAVGDVEFQRKCIGKMQDVAGNGRTVLFVSHNMSSVKTLCNKGILLDQGKIAFEGTAEATVEQYLETNFTVANVLADREDRKGGERFRFTNYEVFCRTNNNQNIECGETVTFRIHFDTTDKALLNDKLSIGLGFFDLGGNVKTVCKSSSINAKLSFGKGYADCTFEKFPLSPGRYYFNLTAFRNDGQMLDWVKEVDFIQVLGGDFYGSGIIPASGMQTVLSTYTWE